MSEISFDQHVAKKLENDHYMKAHNIEVRYVKPDYAKLCAEVTESSLNGFGCIHGGVLFGLADTTAGVAAFTDGRHYVTQSGDFHFMANISSGTVFAEGYVIHRGRTICTVEVKVYAEESKLLGSGTFDMFVVNKPFWSA